MKAIMANEMRAVEGGYHLICTKCGKTKYTISRISVTAFFAAHKHKKKGGYAAYDTRFQQCRQRFGVI